MTQFHCNPQRSAQRYRALQLYYAKNVMAGHLFCCTHCATCKASYTSKTGRFSEGQLNAPGSHYDLTMDGQPLRIVMVGQESGTGMAHTSMEQRQAAIARTATEQRFVAEAGHSARTQHMKGITSALRLLFGKGLGTDYRTEFITLAHGGQIHLLHCFALVNYLLCSAHSAKRSKRGESTATMRRNCNAHFRATLEILEPTLIIVGGKSMWPHVRRAFDTVEPVMDSLFKARFNGQVALVACFAHPSAMHPHNWGVNAQTPYLLTTVAPVLMQMRSLLLG